MEFEMKPSIKIPDGQHKGKIIKIEYRDTPYQYTDVFIKEQETGLEIKAGFPSVVSEKSKLGKLLQQFQQINVGEMVNPETVLVDKEVTFMTILEKTDTGEFVRVVDGSIKPTQ